MKAHENIPDITWEAFSYFNRGNPKEFEDMCRKLFCHRFLKTESIPNSIPNNPGIEIEPILEAPREDGTARKRISFQAKYLKSRVKLYDQLKESAEQTVKYYAGKLDLVYIFCNLQVNTHTKKYKETEKILRDANIEIQLIAHDALLDMVMDDLPVANYYFGPRDQKCAGSSVCSEFQIAPVKGGASTSIGMISTVDRKIVIDLVSDRVNYIRSEILNLNLKKIRPELEELLVGNIDGFDQKQILYFYGFLLALQSDTIEKANQYSAQAVDQYAYDISFMKNIWQSPREVSFIEFVKLRPETQVILIYKLFQEHDWSCIISLRGTAFENRGSVDDEVAEQLNLHCGLSYVNTGEYDKGHEILDSVQRCHELPHKIFLICAEILKINTEIQKGYYEHLNILSSLLKELAEAKVKAKDIVKLNEVFVASTEMQAYCLLVQHDYNDVFDTACECYHSYSPDVKQNENVKYDMALIHELQGNLDEALNMYSTCNWKEEEATAIRRMLCLIQRGEAGQALHDFEQISVGFVTPHLEGVYLYALSYVDKDLYLDELKKKTSQYHGSLEELFYIAFYVDDRETFDDILAPVVGVLLSEKNKAPLLERNVRINYIRMFAQYDKPIFLHIMLEGMGDVDDIDQRISYEIYCSLFRVLTRDYSGGIYSKETIEILNCAKDIADRFIQKDLLRKEFLQIRVRIAEIEKTYVSMLHYAKELFECEKNEQNAMTVVSLLLENNEREDSAYEPYLDILPKSDVPVCSLAVARVYLQLGRDAEADRYAYKALYTLDGRDDYEVYRGYFGFLVNTMYRLSEPGALPKIDDNTVVALRKIDGAANMDVGNEDHSSTLRMICLDSESEFSNPCNRGMDIEHTSRGTFLYSHLWGLNLKQEISLDGERYIVDSIEPRSLYTGRFVMQQFQKKPDELKGLGYMFSLSGEDPHEMLEQIEKIVGGSDSFYKIMKAYHYEDNGVGLPIDYLAQSDFAKYISIVRALLYEDGEALYAGGLITDNLSHDCYVLSLSALVVLGVMDHFEILNAIKDKIIIPESYMTFLELQYAETGKSQTKSSGSLVFTDNSGPVMVGPDKSLLEILERIITFCTKLKTSAVSVDEKMSAEFIDGLSLEKSFALFNNGQIHMDAFILAKKRKKLSIFVTISSSDKWQRLIKYITSTLLPCFIYIRIWIFLFRY